MVKRKLGAPFFLKPVTQGSSVGVGKVETDEEYRTVLASGFELDYRMLAEEHITGREIECDVLEGTDGSLFVSRPDEIVPSAAHGFYTYDAKYVDPDGVELRVPADLPDDQEASILSMAASGIEGPELIDRLIAHGLARFREENYGR